MARLPAATKPRQQLEKKRTEGGGAPGQLPCFQVGLYFRGAKSCLAALMGGQVEGT